MVSMIEDGYEAHLGDKESSALQLTDDIIGIPGRLGESQIAELRQRYSDAEIVELALGVGLFMGMSKVLITLGLEPEEMATVIIPTPGS